MSARAATLILIGHAGHPEVEGTMGQIPAPVHLVQTRRRRRQRSICRATRRSPMSRRRRSASTTPATSSPRCRAASPTSWVRRPRHLLRDAEPPGGGARTVQGGRRDPGGRRQEQLQFQPAARDRRRSRHPELPDRRRQRARPGWLDGVATVGVTAGASAPEVLVEDVIEALGRLGPVEVSTLPGRQENIEFRLPAELGGRV